MRNLIILFVLVSINCNANVALDQIKAIGQHGSFRKVSINQKTLPSTDNSAISVTSLRGDYQFILFYRASCPHCRRFDPTLKKYADNVGIKVKAFTFDGVSLPSFPNSVVVSKSLLNQYFGDGSNIAVPTLFIMNTKNLHVYPVSRGELTYMDLVRRMNELAPRIQKHEESLNG